MGKISPEQHWPPDRFSAYVCTHTFGFGLPNKGRLPQVAANYVPGTALGSGDHVSAFNKFTVVQDRQCQYSVSQLVMARNV